MSGREPVGLDPESKGGRRVEKPWGHELIWAHTDRYAGKILLIRAGRRLSLQYHEQKDESVFVLHGRLRLHLENESGVVVAEDLEPGAYRRVVAGRRHRYEAFEGDVEFVEVSTPELDDVVRLADDYGREGTSAP
jgi:mannose-6-phosphate isomerase